MSIWQPTLFGGTETAFDPQLCARKRTYLDRASWVDYVPGWLSGQEALFERLRDEVAWRSSEMEIFDRVVTVPRLVASIPDDGPCPTVLGEMTTTLGRCYRTVFDRMVLAYYRDGADSVAWHRDKVIKFQDASLVAILSVGERRRFLLRPYRGVTSHRFTVGWGDLLVMGGSTQENWEHCVPKAKRAGPRICVMFRRSSEFRRGEAPERPRASARV